MKKYLIIGIIAIGIVVFGFIIPPPDGFFGASDDTTIAKLQEKYNVAPKEIKDKYVLENTALKATPKDDPKDRVEVWIGEKPTEKLGAEITNFEPRLTISRWSEVEFSIKPVAFDLVALKDRTLKFDKEKTIFETPKVDYSLYELPIDEDNPEGGFEYQIDLLEKPATNKIEFTLNTKGLDFFYQPSLTQEYKNGYNEQFKKEIVVSETQVKDLEGNVLVNRPENVVGSYAVYASEQKTNWTGGKLYKTGKFGHIYRPKIIDSAGAEVWGILNIDKEAGILSVEIPQSFLDKAVYPIRHAAGSTFGYTSIGGTAESASAGYPIYFFVPEASPVGTLTGISYYADCIGTSVVVDGGFYSATAEKNFPYSRLTQKTGVTILDAPGLYDFDVDDYTLIDGARNYFAFVAPTGNAHNHYYDSVPGEAVVTTGLNFYEVGTSLPVTASTTPTLWSTAQKVSVYGIYTGSATTKPFMGNPIKYQNEYCGYALDVLYHKFKAPTTGLISSITVYVNNKDTSEHGIHVAIYDHDATNNYPENPLGSSTTHGHQAASTSGYVTVDLSAAVSVTAGTTYWLAFQFESADPAMCFYYGTEVGNRYCREASTWGVFPNPAVDSGWDEVGNFPITIYATYTAAGGAAAVEDPPIILIIE